MRRNEDKKTCLHNGKYYWVKYWSNTWCTTRVLFVTYFSSLLHFFSRGKQFLFQERSTAKSARLGWRIHTIRYLFSCKRWEEKGRKCISVCLAMLFCRENAESSRAFLSYFFFSWFFLKRDEILMPSQSFLSRQMHRSEAKSTLLFFLSLFLSVDSICVSCLVFVVWSEVSERRRKGVTDFYLILLTIYIFVNWKITLFVTWRHSFFRQKKMVKERIWDFLFPRFVLL